MKSNTTSISMSKFAAIALAIARQFGLGYWGDEAAAEYTKLVAKQCDLGEAVNWLRDLAVRFERLPSASEVVKACREARVGPDRRWTVTVGGNSNKIAYGRNPLGYGYRPGTTDRVTDAAGERLYHWSECKEGQEFAALWDKIAGKPMAHSTKPLALPTDAGDGIDDILAAF